MGFIEQQASAWTQIVDMMIEQPTNVLINGSMNGPAANMAGSANVRHELPFLLREYKITSMLDVPCGDLSWIRHTDLRSLYVYIGVDVDRRLIDEARRACPMGGFICANILTREKLPVVDLILCRDFLMCLPDEHLQSVIEKFKCSAAAYLLASNYPGSSNTFDYHPEQFPILGYLERPYDLTAPPFNLEQIDGIIENQASAGLVSKPHELALFKI